MMKNLIIICNYFVILNDIREYFIKNIAEKMVEQAYSMLDGRFFLIDQVFNDMNVQVINTLKTFIKIWPQIEKVTKAIEERKFTQDKVLLSKIRLFAFKHCSFEGLRFK